MTRARTILMLALFCLLVTLAPQAFAEGGAQGRHRVELVLVMRTDAHRPAAALRLEHIVRVIDDPSGVWRHLHDLHIPVGADGVITRGMVARRLVEAGVPFDCLRLNGPAIVTLKGTE